MHIHILGICGTFMAGIASIAKEAGHKVTGCDKNVYPPMSDALDALGIDIHNGYDAEQLAQVNADIYIIGNAMTRGHAIVEAILDNKLPYTSGPQWLYDNVLRHKTVIAVAGTHGKTTTSSMVAWLLEAHGLHPGFLIGGMPENFNVSARLGKSDYFVIEADEYDTAFFDKRSKFILYRPDILILNNLEFDHADIFNSLDDIKRQFHHLIRCVPANGHIIFNHGDNNIIDVINRGNWTALTGFSDANIDFAASSTESLNFALNDAWEIESLNDKKQQIAKKAILSSNDITVTPETYCAESLPIGRHNQLNALAAMLAASKIGIALEKSLTYFKLFKMPKRRLEVLFEKSNHIVYRDFAHHPTAIKQTLMTLKAHHENSLLMAVVEMRSNSMKKGVHDELMTEAMDSATLSYVLASNEAQKERLSHILNNEKTKIFCHSSELYQQLLEDYHSFEAKNICLAFLTNGNFDNISDDLVKHLLKQ